MALVVDTVKIIETLISGLSNVVTINSIVDNGDGTFSILTCDTSYATEETEVKIGDYYYPVNSIDQNVSITVSKVLDANPDPVGVEVILNTPFFLHGTVQSVNNVMETLTEDKEKYPFIFLYEVYEEDLVVDKTDAVGFKSKVRMFFMDSSDPQNDTTEDQYKDIVRPMRSLTFAFIEQLEKRGDMINELTSNVKLKPHVNFGKFVSDKGYSKKIFNEDMTGYEINLELPVKRNYVDKLLCKC